MAAAFGAGALAAAAVFVFSYAPATPAPVTRLVLGTRGAATLHVEGNDLELAITPDGSRVVYVGDGGRRIFVRAFDQLEPVAIASGSLLKNPFISTDGQWVGYGEAFQGLWKVPASGGPAIQITPVGALLRGAFWRADDTIVFASSNRSTGLQRVSAHGGTPKVLTSPDAARNEYDHYWPEALPDGRGVLYTILARTGGLSAAKIAVYDLETQYVQGPAGGSLQCGVPAQRTPGVCRRGNAVDRPLRRRAPFDHRDRAPRMKLTAMTGHGAGNFAVSTTGALRTPTPPATTPLRARSARSIAQASWSRWMFPSILTCSRGSPHDGTRVVHATGRAPENNIWVLDIGRRSLTRLRNEAARDQIPSWSLDDRWVFYASHRAGGDTLQIWRQAADGTGEPELMMDTIAASATVSPDGTHLILGGYTPSTLNDVMRMALDGSRKISPLVATRFTEGGALVSPDGRWLVYQSNVSGRQEIYVGPYSRCHIRSVAGVYGRWTGAAVEPRREGAVLHGAGRRADGRAGEGH